jgi:hypothetical protein
MGNKCHTASASEALEKTKKAMLAYVLNAKFSNAFYSFFVCNARELGKLSPGQPL